MIVPGTRKTGSGKDLSGASDLLMLSILLMLPLQSTALEVGGIVQTRSSYAYQAHHWQQHRVQVDLELDAALQNGSLNAVTRLRADAESVLNTKGKHRAYGGLQPVHSDAHKQLELRELYWQGQIGEAFLRIGKQQVVWGEADGLKLLDVVNPQDFREFILDDFEDSRIPLWMLNAEWMIAESSLQWLWIPDTSSHVPAPEDSPYRIRSPLMAPQASANTALRILPADAPSRTIRDSDTGLRLRSYWKGWDWSVNYLFHTLDQQVFCARPGTNEVILEGSYQRSHLIGGSTSTVFGDWTLRGEVAYETDRYHRSKTTLPGVIKANQWGSVVGLDYQGWRDQLLSLQWFQTRIQGADRDLQVDKSEHTISALWELQLLNETLRLRWLHLYSLNHHDGLARPSLRYNLSSSLDLHIAVDHFYGSQHGRYGQFDQADRISLGFEWGFN